MTDYEDLILQRQNKLEMLLEDCDGECERCYYGRPVYALEYWDDPRYRCGLTEDEDDG